VFAVIAGRATPTNLSLVEACWRMGVPAGLLWPEEAEERLRSGDVALARLDVLPTLDGVEAGLPVLRRLADRGVRVFNSAGALLAAHDKAATARCLARHRIPHPATMRVGPGDGPSGLTPPLVLKPRFGSGGRDVFLCRSRPELLRRVYRLRRRPWFERQGAVVQECLPILGHDLRVLVAARQVVGAVARVAPRHEWRTNVAVGAHRQPVEPPPHACALACAAAAAVGADFVGVDLLPVRPGRYVVLEVNGAVDFTTDYAVDGVDPFEEVALQLTRRCSAPHVQSGIG
jgi:tetrahydromethanopterin:alpha-L-glutamate ligase